MSNNIKVYAVVAVVVIIALIGINKTSLALPSGNLSGEGMWLGCCSGGIVSRVEEEPRRVFSGGCCSGSAAVREEVPSEEELQRIGFQFYRESSPNANLDRVEALVVDFGCHQEIHIYKDGVLILKVGYSYGQAYEIP